jgi:hypothetical protein
MCRAPFDLPKYRIRIVIDRVEEGTHEVRSYVTSNIQTIRDEFDLDLRVLDSHEDASMNILFDLEAHEDIVEVLRTLGVPS